MLRALWYGRSVRTQLLLVFLCIDVTAALAIGGMAVARWRTRTAAEMAASMRAAVFIVDAAGDLARQAPPEQVLAALAVRLHALPHVRVTLRDATGLPFAAPVRANGSAGAADHRAPPPAAAPAWFAALAAPPIETRQETVTVDGRRIGRVEITSAPAGPIAAFWDDMVALGGVGVLLNAAMIATLYVLLGRVLDPLLARARGLRGLNRGARGPKPQAQAREFAAVGAHFDASARALAAARAENERLHRRLLVAQEDERRRTARELHDEVGPCLFGLTASASSIANVAADLPDKARLSVSDRLQDIRAIVEHLQAINRSMLERLRPLALGQVPLRELLDALVREQARQHAQMSFTFAAGELKASYGEAIDLTVYRCIQESLTNAMRHAQPNHVAVAVAENAGALELTVRDDGRGVDAAKPGGFGLRGMRERVEGLGGRCRVGGAPGGGTCIRVVLPLPPASHHRKEGGGHHRQTA